MDEEERELTEEELAAQVEEEVKSFERPWQEEMVIRLEKVIAESEEDEEGAISVAAESVVEIVEEMLEEGWLTTELEADHIKNVASLYKSEERNEE